MSWNDPSQNGMDKLGESQKIHGWGLGFSREIHTDLFFQVNVYGFYRSKSPFKLPFGVILLILFTYFLNHQTVANWVVATQIFCMFTPKIGEDNPF